MIEHIELENFLGVARARLDMGQRVTLITGRNGSGKTTRVQALIWALWGKCDRSVGMPKVQVTYTNDQGVHEAIVRTRGKNGELVCFGSNEPWQQKTKASPRVEAIFGQYDAWERSLHLTGRTVSTFALATPSERWVHMESIANSAVWEKALSRAKVELMSAKVARDGTAGLLSQHLTARTKAQSAYTSARMIYSVSESLPEPHYDADAWDRGIAHMEADLAALGESRRVQIEKQNAAKIEVALLAQRVRESEGSESCPTCGANICPADHALLVQHHRDALAIYTSIGTEVGNLYQDMQAAQTSLQNCRNAKERAYLARRSWEMAGQVFGSMETHLFSLLENLATACLRTDQCDVALTLAKHDATVAEDVLQVLTTARSIYFNMLIEQINTVLAQYLDHINAKARVQLRLETTGRGPQVVIVADGSGATTYNDCSGGEQRRIDVCLALAMSQIACEEGALTRAAPLVIDEAFDTLDADGIEALLSLACLISDHRQVVLVSHVNPDMSFQTGVTHAHLGD